MTKKSSARPAVGKVLYRRKHWQAIGVRGPYLRIQDANGNVESVDLNWSTVTIKEAK